VEDDDAPGPGEEIGGNAFPRFLLHPDETLGRTADAKVEFFVRLLQRIAGSGNGRENEKHGKGGAEEWDFHRRVLEYGTKQGDLSDAGTPDTSPI
jgi:hypothetical protein